ncbi:MAG: tetratricopeptide repeat protein [Clostridium sp.]
MEEVKKDITVGREDILKNISDKINFLENKIQYLIDENAELKSKIKEENAEIRNKIKEEGLKNEKLDKILEMTSILMEGKSEEVKNDSLKEEIVKEKEIKEEIEPKKEEVNEVDLVNSKIINLKKEDHKPHDKVNPLNIEDFIKEGEYYLERFYNNEDLLLAIDYLGEASDLGSAYASLKLGDIYYESTVCKDIDLAIEYYKRAAFKREEKAIEKLIEIYEIKGSEGEDIYYHYLGDIYFNGDFVQIDKEKYMEYYIIAAEKGVSESINKLIKVYKGEARDGDAEASYTLGEIYNYGEWVERDIEEAFDWFNKSEADGNEEAKVKCGELAFEIAESLLLEEDIKCIEWYNIASEKENREAQYKLGTLFEKGYIVDEDEYRALELYKKAADNGYFKAITKIKLIRPMQSLFNKDKE